MVLSMGAFYFDGLFLHDDEALAFVEKFWDSADADARYVARRLADEAPELTPRVEQDAPVFGGVTVWEVGTNKDGTPVRKFHVTP